MKRSRNSPQRFSSNGCQRHNFPTQFLGQALERTLLGFTHLLLVMRQPLLIVTFTVTIVHRFQWLNRIPAAALLPAWNDGAEEDIYFDFDLRIALPFVPELNERLGVDRSTFGLAVLAIDTDSVVRALCGSVLRFCPACLALGLHATIHQCRLVTVCPVHQSRLRARCPHCRTPIAYRFDALAAAHPNACPHCYSQLIGEPMRSASRCDQLSFAQRAQFIAIQQLVEHHGNCLSLATRPIGVSADVHTKPLRSRLLFLRRLVNLLDAQSPLSRTEYRSALRRLAIRWLTTQSSALPIGILRYSRRQWPHFSGIYLRTDDAKWCIKPSCKQQSNHKHKQLRRIVFTAHDPGPAPAVLPDQ